MVTLFGAKKYAVCPNCGNKAGDRFKDRSWRAKVDRYMVKWWKQHPEIKLPDSSVLPAI
jgi:hypothetical protein